MSISTQKEQVAAWFRTLRDQICTIFETIERENVGDASFVRSPWTREGGGGGEMSVMRGKIFEKVGVNISSVHGRFSEAFIHEIPGAQEMPHFWASGISLVAHLCSPRVPAVHMNTRHIVLSNVPESPSQSDPKAVVKSWFGGGADLTPMTPDAQDTADFHTAFQRCCDAHHPDYYTKFKTWCDEYFFLKHRGEPRGVGGIFFDYLDTGDWARDYAFTQSVGRTFAEIYPVLVRRHMYETWTPAEREHQRIRRGRYAEFNLLYDRGTRFGLMTGGNTEAILMSLPPDVSWP